MDSKTHKENVFSRVCLVACVIECIVCVLCVYVHHIIMNHLINIFILTKLNSNIKFLSHHIMTSNYIIIHNSLS